MNKTCTNCGEVKEVDKFSYARPNVRRGSCKACQRIYEKKYRMDNPDVIKAKSTRRIKSGAAKAYRQANKDKRNAYLKQWGKDNPDKKKSQKLRHRYGIDLDGYNKIKHDQGSVCALCDKGGKLVVDHCHKSGKVRGLLCQKCNTALGMFDDDIPIVARAVKYLTKHFELVL